jgi:RND family efflux transporter MFP subunit
MAAQGTRVASVLVVAAAATVSSLATAGEFDCIIEPRQVLEIRSPLEGLIERVNVERGDFVTKGQELAALDTSVDRVQASIANHRSQMEGSVVSWQSRGEHNARKLARMDELHRQNYISAQARDEAQTEKQVGEAELRDARDTRILAELEYKRQLEIIRLKTIVSPINGVITERMQHPGEFAEAGVGRKPLLKIADLDVLSVEVVLPATAYGKVKLGMPIQVVSDIPAGSRYRATVKVVDRVLDPASGTFGVRLELLNTDRKIPGGVRCRATFADVDEVAPVRPRDLPRAPSK